MSILASQCGHPPSLTACVYWRSGGAVAGAHAERARWRGAAFRAVALWGAAPRRHTAAAPGVPGAAAAAGPAQSRPHQQRESSGDSVSKNPTSSSRRSWGSTSRTRPTTSARESSFDSVQNENKQQLNAVLGQQHSDPPSRIHTNSVSDHDRCRHEPRCNLNRCRHEAKVPLRP